METLMNTTLVRKTLEEVLTEIQAAGDLECPPLEGLLKPIEALPEFDSKIWPVAIGMLGAKLGIDIPADVNIFRKEGTDIALTIDEIVVNIAALIAEQNEIKSLKVAIK
jgi:hypothetical protein